MKLVEERLSWRDSFTKGDKPIYCPYEEYLANRDSEYWRSSRCAEKFYEWVKWMEDTSINKEKE